MNRIRLALEAFWLILTGRMPLDCEAAAKARTERIAELERQVEFWRSASGRWESLASEHFETIGAIAGQAEADLAEASRNEQLLTEARAKISSLEADLEAANSEARNARRCNETVIAANRRLTAERDELREVEAEVKRVLGMPTVTRTPYQPNVAQFEAECERVGIVDTTAASESDGLPAFEGQDP